MGTSDSRVPSRRLAVLTCMDCRIDPLVAAGLEHGEAHVLRNAGAELEEADEDRGLRVVLFRRGTQTAEAIRIRCRRRVSAPVSPGEKRYVANESPA